MHSIRNCFFKLLKSYLSGKICSADSSVTFLLAFNLTWTYVPIYFSKSVCQKLSKYNAIWQSYCKRRSV